MKIFSDFECGNGKNIQRVSKNHFTMEVEADSFHYMGYFQIIVNNGLKPARLRLDIYKDSRFRSSPAFRKRVGAPIWIKRGRKWSMLPEESISWTDKCITLRVNLVKNEKVYLSLKVPIPYSVMSKYLKTSVVNNLKQAKLSVLGKSIMSREIYLLKITNSNISDKQKKKVLILSGEHATEFPGQWAVKGIIKHFISSLGDDLKKRYIFYIVPQINPDGNISGRLQHNIVGDDLGRSYLGAARGALPVCSEARVLWDWILRNPPDIFIDFHGSSATGGKYPHEFVYRAPHGFYKDSRSKKIQAIVDKYIEEKTGGFSRLGNFSGTPEEMTKTLLGNLALVFGTAGCIYEPGMCTGTSVCEQTGVNVLRTVIAACEEAGK